MILSYMLAAVFLFLAGLFNSIMDCLADEVNFAKSKFGKLNKAYWLKSESWIRKYRRYKNTNTIVVLKHDANGKPIYKPNFPFSTGLLVAFTDAWHLAKSLCVTCLLMGCLLVFGLRIASFEFWLTFALIRAVSGSGFVLGFNSIFRA